MGLTKTVQVEIDAASWPAGRPVPAALTAMANNGSVSVDVLQAMLYVGLMTRPPVSYGFDLSDCWAWLRYSPALKASPDLRLCDEWTTLDPHHKTILSGDFGVGFTGLLLAQTLGFAKYSDTLWVVNTLGNAGFAYASTTKRGPNKSPDYIVEDSVGNISILECKGTQTGRKNLYDALSRGVPQKQNLQAVGATVIAHSLVAGLYVPQSQHTEDALFAVCDPDWEEVRGELARFSKSEITRGITQVSAAKEIALFELPQTANSLVRARQSSASPSDAVRRDLATKRGVRRVESSDGLSITEDYRWEEPRRLSEELTAVGIRFRGEMPSETVTNLRTTPHPEEFGEREQQRSVQRRWEATAGEHSATLKSPYDNVFHLELLEV